ncbi:type II toxin-antitoxin system RelE/ParE family toxin [Steroidobacter sp.]|uniref:type II toxin-antitoxin system RelE/ParE family toxin n=1 Tax=Steroidobacter sp. TaxID=1978227 RepID=UPI001A522BA2|nr:type II toxin-antitoxin system RelE/ParE family toxin [Steroidobacter sp.]
MISYSLRITETALNDIAEVYVYIAFDSAESIATDYVSKLEHALEPLRDLPTMGSPRNALGEGAMSSQHDGTRNFVEARAFE